MTKDMNTLFFSNEIELTFGDIIRTQEILEYCTAKNLLQYYNKIAAQNVKPITYNLEKFNFQTSKEVKTIGKSIK